MTTISPALYQAILQARQANPTAYANVASNYLLGDGLNTSQIQAIANTGTFAITTSSGNYGVVSTPTGVTAVPITNTLSGIVSKFLSPSLPYTIGTNLPGSTAGPNTQTVFTPAANTSDSLTTTFNKGLSQFEGFFKNHPELLLAIGGLAALLLLKK
ncbi:MAG: hypothetical protein KGI08_09880 [Thaumarchaeota archaeon]|nr:hypothetical protein [Nitrososphaerota archaeon]